MLVKISDIIHPFNKTTDNSNSEAPHIFYTLYPLEEHAGVTTLACIISTVQCKIVHAVRPSTAEYIMVLAGCWPGVCYCATPHVYSTVQYSTVQYSGITGSWARLET